MRTTLALSLAAFLLGAKAQDITEDQMNQLTDPTAECAYHNYAPLTNAMSSFPPIGTPVAGILPGDTAGKAKFASMTNIPNIAPKGVNGTTDPNISYPATDPDCWWSWSLCTTPKLSGLKPDIFNVPEPRTLGYGFDDGPNCSHNAFYDYLSQQKQKATMFYIGTNVVANPLQAIRAAVDGHEICVHTWSHHQMTAFTNEQVFGELWYTMQVIKLVTGLTPTCWRPPQGDVDDRVRYIAQQLGLQNVLWKYDANDWKVASGQATPEQVQQNYDYLIANVSAGTFDTEGAIMLTHELDNYTMQTAIDNYPKLAKAFDHIVPVAVGFNKTQPYVENNVTFPNFAQYVSGASPSSGNSASPSSSAGAGSNSAGGNLGNSSNPHGGVSAGLPLRITHGGLLALIFAMLGAGLVL